MAGVRKWFGDHNFVNDSSEMVVVMLEPGERVKLVPDSRPHDYGFYDGGDFGYELEVGPGQESRSCEFPFPLSVDLVV